jgi:hypothetical protein
MNRRAFVTGLGAVLAAPLAAKAQPAETSAADTVLDTTPRPIAWLSSQCVRLADPYVPEVKRICRVNLFRPMGAVNGKRLYFALYRRLVVLPNDNVAGGSDHLQAGSAVDRPPFINTAVVIFEESEGGKAWPILAAANEGSNGSIAEDDFTDA